MVENRRHAYDDNIFCTPTVVFEIYKNWNPNKRHTEMAIVRLLISFGSSTMWFYEPNFLPFTFSFEFHIYQIGK